MTITATNQQSLTIVELPGGTILPAGPTQALTHSAFNQTKRISAAAAAAAPGSLAYVAEVTGTLNLDLTSFAGRFGTEDGTGKKVQAIQVNNLSTTDELVISDGVLSWSGAPAPYSLNGGDDITIPPGGSINHYYADQLADVAADAKAIDFTPAAGEQFQVAIVLG